MIKVIDIKKLIWGFLVIIILISGTGKLYAWHQDKLDNKVEVVEKNIEVAGQTLVSDAARASKKAKKEDFFAAYRLMRENMRSREIEMLEKIINSEKTEKKAKDAASLRIVQITREMEQELKIENLIRSKGFADCVVFLQPEGVSIVIKGDGLSEGEESEIRKLVKGILGENNKISIILKAGEEN
ncbi:stage III sporulation protein AH [Thermosyntropha lipolytica DSM 11003]|uniref:Stage III sporulation protein AH n=1 Tax=Thermosyntropha lipolytica DSM 11003 TaxID=1123382 RepID=A0A1M5LJ73_9FIRM|nr:SpoIIIAH-like family protein [Thermosyntropha lipolytica]SHG65162.1 stage III sporulation protein AH [Thermosyntropha lipolytica DSM 11003]